MTGRGRAAAAHAALRPRWVRTLPKLLPLLVLLRPATEARAQGLTGHWEGSQRQESAVLPITLDFPEDRPGQGFFTAGDLGAMDVPLANVRADGRQVHFELIGDHTTVVFTGVLRAHTLRGTFTDGRDRGVFELRRTSVRTEKPYAEREVRFSDGGVTLAGTLLVPRSPGRHPAVVFLHGSGPEGRWANRFTADYLARRGVAALVYDKRGVGESGGDWRTSTLEDLAADARSGVSLLAMTPEVDRRCVGVYGHSQGGFIAPMVARADANVAWIIDADGNAGPQYRQDLFRVETALGKRYAGSELDSAMALYREFVDVARNDLPHTQLRADAARAAGTPWLDALALPDDTSWVWRWYRGVGNTDNSAAWRAVRVPVLLLYGGNDAIVPPRESIDLITGLLREAHDTAVDVRVLPGADHTLRIPPERAAGWPRYAPGYPDLVARWISPRCPGGVAPRPPEETRPRK